MEDLLIKTMKQIRFNATATNSLPLKILTGFPLSRVLCTVPVQELTKESTSGPFNLTRAETNVPGSFPTLR
jgi:hypothetical protein